ncbi:MAG: hypothetical protein AB7I08_15145 [Thermoleophilia bacterium]
MSNALAWQQHLDARGRAGSLLIQERGDLPPGLRPVVEPEPLEFVFGPQVPGQEKCVMEAMIAGSKTTLDGELACEGVDEFGLLALVVDTHECVAHHQRFFLPDELQGHGIARRRLEAAKSLYRGLGLTEIRLRAENVGKYAWASLGFRFADGETRELVNVAVRRFARELELVLPFLEFADPADIVSLNEWTAANGAIYDAVVDTDLVWDVLARRFDRPFWPPPRPARELRVGQALLLYADYDGWDAVLPLY